MRNLLQNKKFILSATSVLSAVAGGAAGFALAHRLQEMKYEAIIEKEVAEAKRYYLLRAEKKDPVEIVRQYADDTIQEFADDTTSPNLPGAVAALQNYVSEASLPETPGAHPRRLPEPEDDSEETVTPEDSVSETTRNVFQHTLLEGDWDYDLEVANRTIEAPYIIHRDEFNAGEKGYEQAELSYFDGDDVLVDEKSHPIDETDLVVGDINLQKFGHGSKDHNVLYVRNDGLEIDFCVTKNSGLYTEQVLGILQHGDRPGSRKPRRMRDSDDG